ncbi:endonuclease/exonuclease/phosphatase family protein [Nocardioides sp. CFH 31398]|uniref:endonuclease/exonuclease/phosphatase family protein n=1 Tax=Nocardioides sp. CFH 31398 TaxID=2919579 RepID=UPI001F05EFD2|nr:endonuclease/exonuclease/phosphatase family protein [Nocardioides sp. CFH 31398]MCH1867933.1 endonuclease/exonuclease/phosphatase family protein [Nocardioides sp. CFH 31398]
MLTRRRTLGTSLGVAAALGAAAGTGPAGHAAAAPARRPKDRPLVGPARGDDVHVMTFNIRLDRGTATQPGQPDHWGDRAPLVTRLLASERPTLLGVQEATYGQLDEVERGVGRTHRMLGFGRSGGSAGEYSAIFYDAERFVALEWDQYWLSDTPDVIGSATWGNTVTRIVTWARFADRRTGRELVHLNTHFDHQSENARARSAAVLRDQVAGLDVPALLTGDFNAPAGSSTPWTTLTGDGTTVDTWDTARRRLTPAWGTFPNYAPPVEGERRIDWVLATPDVRVLSAAINATTYDTGAGDDRWPSDHTPVQALVRLP